MLYRPLRRPTCEHAQAGPQALEQPGINSLPADVRVNLRYISELPLDTFTRPGSI